MFGPLRGVGGAIGPKTGQSYSSEKPASQRVCRKICGCLGYEQTGDPGFEPGLTGSEPVVLPLHQSPRAQGFSGPRKCYDRPGAASNRRRKPQIHLRDSFSTPFPPKCFQFQLNVRPKKQARFAVCASDKAPNPRRQPFFKKSGRKCCIVGKGGVISHSRMEGGAKDGIEDSMARSSPAPTNTRSTRSNVWRSRPTSGPKSRMRRNEPGESRRSNCT